MKKLAILIALALAGSAGAQGIAINKDSTLRGSGSVASPMGLAACVTIGHTWIWNGSAFACSAAGTTYTAGDGLTLTGADFDLDTTNDFQITGGKLDMSTSVTMPGALDVAGNASFGDAYTNEFDVYGDSTFYSDDPSNGSTLLVEAAPIAATSGRIAGWFINDGSYNATASSREAKGIDARCTAERSSGANPVYCIAGHFTASGTDTVDRALRADEGDVLLNTGVNGKTGVGYAFDATLTYQFAVDGTTLLDGASTLTGLVTATAGVTTSNDLTTTGTGDVVSADDVTAGDDLVVGDASDLKGLISNSTGALVLADDVTIGASTSSTLAFTNGPDGINKYEGKHLEWTDEWLNIGKGLTAASQGITIGNYSFSASVGKYLQGSAVSGRPGILELTTLTGAAAYSSFHTNTDTFSFATQSSSTFEITAELPILSTSSEEYTVQAGFGDGAEFGNANQTDGCYFAYDRAGTKVDPGTGDATGTPGDYWQIWCDSNGARSGWILNTTSNAEDSFPRVVSAVVAATYYRLRVVVDAASKAHFWINGVEVGRITTNIPNNATTRVFAAEFYIVKSVGTTARVLHVDQTRIAIDLNSARSP